MLLERKTAPQGTPADCLSSWHREWECPSTGTGNGKDSDPAVCEGLIWSSHSNLWFWGDPTRGESRTGVHSPCQGTSQTSLPALLGNGVWLQTDTDPEQLPEHSNLHTLGQDHAMAVSAALMTLCWYSKGGSSHLFPAHSKFKHSSTI